MPIGNRFHGLLSCSLAVLLLGTAAACSPATPSLPAHGQLSPVESAWRLAGRVDFPERSVQLTPGGVVNQATVTLYDKSNQAIAVGRTDAAGAFSLDPGTGFNPAVGDTFVLDAYKTATTTGIGSDVVRLRTVVSWGGSSWNSVSGSAILVNAATTAVCVIQVLNAGILSPRDALNAVTGAVVTSAVPAIAQAGSSVTTLVTDLLTKDQDPIARISYASGRYAAIPDAASVVKLERFQPGSFADTVLDASGYLQLSGPKPLPRDASSETAYFQAASVANDGAGVVATDGTYLYVKAWGGYANTTADANVYKKIGTGFNGTTRGQNYGKLGTVTPSTSTAFYWNGGVYCNTGNPAELCRVDVTTGTVTTVPMATTTLVRSSGLPGVGSLYTTDGTYVYCLAYRFNSPGAIDSGGSPTPYNGFIIQVLNPANGFSLVRQFHMDTDSYYVDGLFCDGTYIYPIEWKGTAVPARIRRYRLSDGVREYEGSFLQNHVGNPYNAAANDPISGSWDPVNRVFWIGNLTNEWVHMLRAGTYHTGGTYTSAPLDSRSGAAHYGRLTWTATTPAGTTLSFKVRSANTLADLEAATWYGPTGAGDSYTTSGTLLNPLHLKQRYLQVRATMATSDTQQSPRLQSLGVEVLP